MYIIRAEIIDIQKEISFKRSSVNHYVERIIILLTVLKMYINTRDVFIKNFFYAQRILFVKIV